MKAPMNVLHRIIRACAAALLLTLASASVGGLAAAAEPPVGTAAVAPAIPGARSARAATPAEIATYGQRDEKAPEELGRFAGGDVVVIGASTVAIVLLIVLIVLLI
jgi:hypothetical protein